MTTSTVTDDLAARALAGRLADLDRLRTYVVAACDERTNQPTVDVTALTTALGRDQELVVVDARVVRDLDQALPDHGGLRVGMVRVYPPEVALDQTRYWLPGDLTPRQLTAEVIDHLAQPPATATPAPVSHATAVAGPGALAATALDADRLAEVLLEARRTRPVVLCSTPAGAPAPHVDLDEIHAALGDLVEIVTITTGAATLALSRHLPSGLGAFGGACRVYPPDSSWLTDREQAPLRFAYSLADRDRVTSQLISDAWRALPVATTTTQQQALSASGVVLGIVGGRGMVRLSSGAMATIWPEAFGHDLAADQLLAVGMPVWGTWLPDLGRLDVTAMLQDPTMALAAYQPGTQVLVRAAVVDADRITVELLPGATCRLARDQVTTTALPLHDLVSPGEVLVARIRSAAPAWGLDLDADDNAPIQPAPALLTGGPAWLTLPIDETEATPLDPDAPTPTTQDPQADIAPEPSVGGDDAWQQERAQLVDQLDRARAKTERLRAELAAARTRHRTLSRDHQRLVAEHEALQASTGRAADDEHLFTDPADQFRFEVQLAWARRIPAGQKNDLPLGAYRLGDDFLPTLAASGADPRKVVDVVVEILTGLDVDLDSREVHQLRTSAGGNASALSRGDGASCWRASIQRKAPQARRLHFWRCPDGTVELASVRLHDDLRP